MFAGGADGNGRDRSPFTWRDRVLAEAVLISASGCESSGRDGPWGRVRIAEPNLSFILWPFGV